ncbi:hypothetical protein Asulf_00741 [Archaeoglobus sulfaticallidus PM70-1]|uniref:Flavinylation-associated cytochrome domain-containing protein n=1 Tax=Archaeoglobus sulfaticallidus PM70-1 TaxID=387631 RepID=N0BAX1_9EURY|nr:DUF4405 domain-containing protein [Archaeoglobus sulfaticallidus]AGK60754.1 hypothetical protein Asulf_00741 [Archaeoglobus sulfaticallidus PM70-1]
MGRRLTKTIIDVLLLTGLIIMGITGLGMYLAPSGRVARETHWTFLGLDKSTLGDVHTYFGFVMVAIGVIHLTLNWKPLTSLLKNLKNSGSDMAKVVLTLMLVIAGVFVYLNTLGRA